MVSRSGPDFIGGRRCLKAVEVSCSENLKNPSEITESTFNVSCKYRAPSKPLATYSSTKSKWYHVWSKLDQNKRMIPSPASKMPARHAIGRMGVRIFVPSAPFSNLIVGTGRMWEWAQQKLGIEWQVSKKFNQFDLISREASPASRYGICSCPSFCPSRAPRQSFCV